MYWTALLIATVNNVEEDCLETFQNIWQQFLYIFGDEQLQLINKTSQD